MSSEICGLTVVIVLGNRDPEVMKKRLLAGVRACVQRKATHLLLSGGCVVGSRPEALIMKDFLEEMAQRGEVPDILDETRVLLETESKYTAENLTECDKLLKLVCSDSEEAVQLVICTSSFHLPRVILMSKVLLPKYEISYAGTQEEVTPEEKSLELTSLGTFMHAYADEILTKS